ncbi:MAG: hypothetical protein E7177_03555 [Erysipelotrichaceae bacterium]|nr:hypothetical protein [Erysipelotrichaceae bacterium]
MVKPFFTRKNLIVIALSFFYALVIVFTGVCIDGNHAIISKKNILNVIATNLGFQSVAAGIVGFVTLLLIGIYIVLTVAALCYARRYAKVNKLKVFSGKMILIYAAIVILSILLSLGLGILITVNRHENIGLLMLFLSQTLALGSLVYLAVFGLFAFAAMLVINFFFIDKPFKFWDKNEEVKVEEVDDVEVDVTSSFDLETKGSASVNTSGGVVSATGGDGISTIKKVEELDDREKVFPALFKMDIEYGGYSVESVPSDDLSLEELCERFRNYLAKEEKLYFDIDTIRVFISAFAASHFMILEGLSGTGKSSLPRYFAKFVKANLFFVPVQTTWRDKTNVIGYFNDFSKTYSETDFLLNLYHANYNPDQIHVFVLDEMNISRVEYYFADFLSVLEYPEEEWKLRLMQLPHNFIPPARLEDGLIQIPNNSYFIGTANKDDSTFSIADKVYDRAITIDFDYRNEPFEVKGSSEPISLSKSKLHSLYNEAQNKIENKMTKEDYKKLESITDLIYEHFDVTFGNRILNQIEVLVPTFIACGGKKEDVLDFLLTRKVLVKIEGRFEEYVKGALKQLLGALEKAYGKGVFKRSEKAINQMIKRL